MSNFLPIIGKHEILEVYTRFERPSLFSAKSEYGSLYIVSLADETDEGELWLAAPMTPEQKRQLEAGALPLRDVFTSSNVGIFKYDLPFYTDPAQAAFEIVPQADVQKLAEYLPVEGYCLDYGARDVQDIDTVLISAFRLSMHMGRSAEEAAYRRQLYLYQEDYEQGGVEAMPWPVSPSQVGHHA